MTAHSCLGPHHYIPVFCSVMAKDSEQILRFDFAQQDKHKYKQSILHADRFILIFFDGCIIT